MTKGGPVPPPPPPPHGYVEPVPELYAALRRPVETLAEKLGELGFPDDKALSGNITRLAEALKTLEAIARKELAGEIPTDEEYRFIEDIGMHLHVPTGGFRHYMDVTDEFMTGMDNRMPVVADVQTDVNSKQVLEEAVGLPMTLYFVAPVDGKDTVCIGATYSYYEFKQPMSERLTDEEWREMLREDKQPSMPEWTSRYVAVVNP